MLFSVDSPQTQVSEGIIVTKIGGGIDPPAELLLITQVRLKLACAPSWFNRTASLGRFQSKLILSFHRTWNNELFRAFLSVSPSFIAGFNESIWNASFCWRPPKGSNLRVWCFVSLFVTPLWLLVSFVFGLSTISLCCLLQLEPWSTCLSSRHLLSLGFPPFNFVSDCFQIDLFMILTLCARAQLDRLLPLIRRFTRGRRPRCCRHSQSRCCTTAHFTAYTSVIKQL